MLKTAATLLLLGLSQPAAIQEAQNSLPSTAQHSITYEGYGPFIGSTFIEDNETGIILTRQHEAWRNAYHLDIRGPRTEGAWQIEFFCEPDSVIFVRDANGTSSYYLPYLVWIDDVYLDSNRAIIESRHTSSMGSVDDLLPSEIQAEAPQSIDIVERHEHRFGSSAVRTTISVTNSDIEAKSVSYIYQDAAYMWFPRGNQVGVEPISITATPDGVSFDSNNYGSSRTIRGYWQFRGTIDRNNGVIAGLLSFQGDQILGVVPEYIGFSGIVIDNIGWASPAPDRIASDMIDLTWEAPVGNSLRNRFIELDFGEVAPSATVSRSFYRIMTVLPENQRTDSDIDIWVRRNVQAIQGL